MSDIDIVQLRRLDMTLLLVFAELVRQRKMTIVAQRLGLTQSAISHSLKRLRDVFQDELFLRGSNGFEPTERALRLESKVLDILALSKQALSLDKTFDPRTEARLVRVGGLDYEVAMFAAPLIERLRKLAPKARLVFKSLARKPALAGLRAGSSTWPSAFSSGQGAKSKPASFIGRPTVSSCAKATGWPERR